MPDKTKIGVTIGGVRYTLAGEGDIEHLQMCAEMMDKTMTEIKRSFGNLPEPMAAVLAGCNIAEQYLTLLEATKNQSNLREENRKLREENTVLLKKLAQISNTQNRRSK